MRVTFTNKTEVAKNIFTFRFNPEQPVEYQAGQYTQITLPHKPEDKRGHKRWFTLSSSPTEPTLAITTKYTPEKGSSFKNSLLHLAEGTELQFASPEGDFTLDKDPTKILVFVAGGIGVTPFHSIIQYLTDKNQERPIQLIYAANNPDEFAFRDLFDNTPSISQVKYISKEATAGWEGSVGILNAASINSLASGLEGKIIYLSGPEPMIEALESELRASGVDKKQIRTDFFPGYTKY